ncbi:hypothetical protein [Neobacillus mesonae]|uniref:hypothetical protein n=1 Tax=Neobacillus mesonae TaxID=1193713 RepID=UPI00203B607B|nr:hypothetical protein [Neobacillus mesonae]MCM3571330.1 hypothetical protein [Neobacillus mesonae]
MAKSKNAKWVIGLSGTALSAFVISQAGANQNPNVMDPPSISTNSMSKEEKKLVELDWTNFDINDGALTRGAEQSDRQTRRS